MLSPFSIVATVPLSSTLQIFSKETEHFAGEILLAKQEIIKSLAELVGLLFK